MRAASCIWWIFCWKRAAMLAIASSVRLHLLFTPVLETLLACVPRRVGADGSKIMRTMCQTSLLLHEAGRPRFETIIRTSKDT